MKIEIIIIMYVIGLLMTVGISFLKNKFFTTIPVIVSSILFIITKEENLYHLAFWQIIVCFVSVTVQYILKMKMQKKRNSEIEKLKIKDLM